MTLPTKPQSRATLGVTPLTARVFLAGMPKGGKSTLAAGWAPDTTLLIDTHGGTTLLDGEHFVQHVSDWKGFEATVKELTREHRFKTVVIDLIDDVWKFADRYAAEKNGQVAAGLVEYGKGTAEAEGLFRREIGTLLSLPIGVWFIGHTDTVEEGKPPVQRYIPRLDKRVRTYVEGVCHFVWMLEALGPKRRLHTQPSAKFQAGSRVRLPDPFVLDAEPFETNARQVYAAMARGLGVAKPSPVPSPAESTPDPKQVAA